MRAKTQLGKVFELLIRTYQLWAGIRQHVLIDTQPCSWIPDHWLSKLRATMHELHIQIRYESWNIPPLRKNDRYLMNDFVDQDFPSHKLAKLNACCMYLQVTTLAEIVDHTGEELLPQALSTRDNPTPKGLLNISRSTLQWPTVALPSTTCWRLWTTTVQTIYTGSRTGTRLQQQLGNWETTYDTYRFWHWRQLDPTHLMYRFSNLSASRVALRTQHRRTMSKFSPSIPTELPFQGPPITPIDPTTGYVCLPVVPIPQLPTMTPTFPSYPTIQQQF